MKSFFKTVIIILPIAIVALLLCAYLFINQILRKGVETLGPQLTQTSVQLKDLRLSLLSGEGQLEGLSIGNPEGFKTPQAIELGRLNVQVDLQSIPTDTIRIRSIEIVAPEITVEGLEAKNLRRIQENVTAKAPEKDPGDEPEADAEPGKKVVIDHLVIRDGKVNYSPAILMGKSIPIPLPDLELKDIGKEKGGTTPAEVASRVLSLLLDAVLGSLTASADLIASGLNGITDAAGVAGAAVADVTEAATDAVSDSAEMLGAGASKLAEGIGGLLGGKTDKDAP